MNLCQVRGGLPWRAHCLWILLIAGWGCGVILILSFLLTGSLGLREVDEERLLVFCLPLPLIKAISQDDTALSFYQGVLWGESESTLSCIHPAETATENTKGQKSLAARKPHAPCRFSSPIYFHCGSCWYCIASCWDRSPWTRKEPDPSAWRPTHTHPQEHSAGSEHNNKGPKVYYPIQCNNSSVYSNLWWLSMVLHFETVAERH